MLKTLIFCLVLNLTFAVQMRSFADKNDIHDKEHIKQHLEDKIDISASQLDPERERFHYFSIHDLNKDNVIDGIELMKAITHTHGENQHVMSDNDLEQLVDKVLEDMDANRDGFISYAEYSVKQS